MAVTSSGELPVLETLTWICCLTPTEPLEKARLSGVTEMLGEMPTSLFLQAPVVRARAAAAATRVERANIRFIVVSQAQERREWQTERARVCAKGLP